MTDINTTNAQATMADEPQWGAPCAAEEPESLPVEPDWTEPGAAKKPEDPDIGLMLGVGGGCYRQGGECHWAPQVTLRLNHPFFTIEGQQAGPASLPIRGYVETGIASNGSFHSAHVAAPVMFLDPEFFHLSIVPRFRVDHHEDAWHPVGELALRLGLKAYKDLSVSVEYGLAWWNVGGSDPQKDYFWNADSVGDGVSDFFKPGTFSVNLEWFF
ncbi:MAG: hypothetical protein HQM16_01040 [Deltaproteobacteria bacterium]|nr:hypothetical protein [Deltaproteobacteria bacterium]